MSVFTVTVLSDEKVMDPAYELLTVDIERTVNRIPRAELTLIDGSSARQAFAISDAGSLDPGKNLEIKIRYEDKPGSETTIFKGLVVTHRVEADAEKSLLSVEAKGTAIQLTQVRSTRVFRKQSDSQVIKTLLSDHHLPAGEIPDTKPAHEEIIQYACTDWDFMMTRADANGLLVSVEDGGISLKKMALDAPPKLSLEYGISEIYSFEIEATADGQCQEIGSVAWDVKDRKMTQVRKAKAVKLSPGNLDASQLAGTLGAKTCTLVSAAALAPDELQAWADARMARSRLSLIRGRISVPGFSGLKPLDAIEIKGIGKHFNGKTLVTGIRHRINEQGWVTDLQLGLSADCFSARSDVAALPAAGLLPAVSGLHIGVVADFLEDTEKQFRVRVKVPAFGEKQGALWARLASPDAGKDRGFFFRPEPGDEVVLGFFNEDPRQPVIIGALFGPTNTPPARFKIEKENKQKGLVSRKGALVGFDDEKARIYIETPKSTTSIVLDGDEKKILLSDQNGNTITMDKDGITMKSAKDFKLEADGNVDIKGSKVDIK